MKPTPEMIEVACKAHTPQFDRMDQDLQVYARQQMSEALSAALSVQPAAAVVGKTVARDIDWGGQAFPSEGGSDSGLYPDPGMSLRDFHASSALKGFCANPAIFAGNDYSGWALVNCTEEQLAVVCHRLADAMIAARKKVASHE